MALALTTKESLSSVAARVLEYNLVHELDRVEKIQKYLAANKTETQIYYRTKTMNSETQTCDTLEDGIAYDEDTLVKEALQRWQLLQETDTE